MLPIDSKFWHMSGFQITSPLPSPPLLFSLLPSPSPLPHSFSSLLPSLDSCHPSLPFPYSFHKSSHPQLLWILSMFWLKNLYLHLQHLPQILTHLYCLIHSSTCISKRDLKFSISQREILIPFHALVVLPLGLLLLGNHISIISADAVKYLCCIFFLAHIHSSASFIDCFKAYHQPDYHYLSYHPQSPSYHLSSPGWAMGFLLQVLLLHRAARVTLCNGISGYVTLT